MAPTIRDMKGVENWLRGRPDDWALALAMRTGLRALPHAKLLPDDDMLLLFRLAFVAWHDSLLNEVARIPVMGTVEAQIPRTISPSLSCLISVCDSEPTSEVYRPDLVQVIHFATRAANPDIIWRGLNADMEWLAPQSALDSPQVASSLARLPLFINRVKVIDAFLDDINRFLERLIQREPHWGVWADWFAGRVSGRASFFFDVQPNQAHRRIAFLGDHFWDRKADAVNNDISSLIFEDDTQTDDALPDTGANLPPPGKGVDIRTQFAGSAPVIAVISDDRLDAINGPPGGVPKSYNPLDLTLLLETQRRLLEMVTSDLHSRGNLPIEVSRTLARYNDVISEDRVLWYLADSLARVIERNRDAYLAEWPGDVIHYLTEVLTYHNKLRTYLDLAAPANADPEPELPVPLTEDRTRLVSQALDQLNADEETVSALTENSALFLGHVAKVVRSADPADAKSAIKALIGYLITAQDALNQAGERRKGLLTLLGFAITVLKAFKIIP